MRENRYTQVYVADKADVDQATVSRFLKKPPQRATQASQKLCNYAKALPPPDAGFNDGQAAAQKVLKLCWNKSEAHGQAASKILDALAELCRHDCDEEVAPG
ncbi:MAG TPA: hypothetical protein VHX11_10995 [Acidobacteriaceae bacterium]|nr:hypothetical protein [Acidobacteriaceae bacterium]